MAFARKLTGLDLDSIAKNQLGSKKPRLILRQFGIRNGNVRVIMVAAISDAWKPIRGPCLGVATDGGSTAERPNARRHLKLRSP